MTAVCPICRMELIPNTVSVLNATDMCPSKTHYVFYDEPRNLWLVSKERIKKDLVSNGLNAETFPIQDIIRHVVDKGNHGVVELSRQLKEHFPSASLVLLGEGASADTFVYDPATRYFCFVEVKTKGKAPTLGGDLSPDELRFGKIVEGLRLPYFVAWFDESKLNLSFHKLAKSGYLVPCEPPWNAAGVQSG